MGAFPKKLQNVNAIAMNSSQLLHATVLSWTSMCNPAFQYLCDLQNRATKHYSPAGWESV